MIRNRAHWRDGLQNSNSQYKPILIDFELLICHSNDENSKRKKKKIWKIQKI